MNLWTMNSSVSRDGNRGGKPCPYPLSHLPGHSWGGMLAQQYVLDKAPDASVLTIANSTASMRYSAVWSA